MKTLKSTGGLIVTLLVGVLLISMLTSCYVPRPNKGIDGTLISSTGISHSEPIDVFCVNGVAYFAAKLTPIYHRDGSLAVCSVHDEKVTVE